ncbi:FUSC family protein [Mesorhizobium sp. NPDC059054]|uniref:FUSC family protein n=1 Tax=Mesorhizobium sp. NPDC059054 TaxID=3346711 RepID=UPI003682F158
MLYQPPSRTSTLSLLWDELQPYPGRLDLSLRIALVCVLVTVTAMALQVPEAALSCYLVFFASRADAGTGIITAAGVLIGATFGIGLGILCLMVVADSPMLRLGLVAFFTFAGMYLAQASKAGPPLGTVAMVFAFVMTLYDIVPIAELLVRALAWMWVVVFFPMIYLIALNVVAGRSPARLLRNEVAERLESATELIDGGDQRGQRRAGQLLAAGNGEVGKYRVFSRILSLMNQKEAMRSGELAEASFALLTLALARSVGGEGFGQGCAVAAVALREQASDIRARRLRATTEAKIPNGLDPDIARLIDRIARIQSKAHEPRPLPAGEQEGFFASDAFTNPVYTQFALKTLLAVMITYITYTALNWFEIHTAMITCFMVALGSTGETMHKLTLRIIGCLIGGAMAFTSTVWLVPHMTDIGHLALLVGAASFIAAWVSVGSERISYMGWQIALCFFLVVLHGFGPSLDTDAARDRIIGIIFGNVVVWLVFSTIWPVSVGAGVRKHLASGISALADLMTRQGERVSAYADLAGGLSKAMRQAEMLRFEAKRVRRGEIQADTAEQIADEIEAMAVPIILLREHGDATDPHHRMPKPVKAATQDYENTVAEWLSARTTDLRAGRWNDAAGSVRTALRRIQARLSRAERSNQAGFPRKLRAELATRLALYEEIAQAVERAEAKGRPA